MDPVKMLDVLGEVHRPAYHLIPAVLQHQYDFASGLFPTEHKTDDAPPKRLGPREDLIPIDEYLGLYEHTDRRITLFNQGIREAATRLDCTPESLKQVVILHEWAHAFVHLGLTPEQRQAIAENPQETNVIASCTLVFYSVEDALHENLAQLLTLHALDRLAQDATLPEAKKIIARTTETFHELARRQPAEYRIDDYFDVPLSRVVKGFGLIKRQWLMPTIEAWKTVLTW